VSRSANVEKFAFRSDIELVFDDRDREKQENLSPNKTEKLAIKPPKILFDILKAFFIDPGCYLRVGRRRLAFFTHTNYPIFLT
jgi:hypothetical protein